MKSVSFFFVPQQQKGPRLSIMPVSTYYKESMRYRAMSRLTL